MRGVTVTLLTSCDLRRKFQLTRLMRGVTVRNAGKLSRMRISTHTPHARRDETPKNTMLFAKFQLTRLMRGVTSGGNAYENVKEISTHTPHARRDQ